MVLAGRADKIARTLPDKNRRRVQRLLHADGGQREAPSRRIFEVGSPTSGIFYNLIIGVGALQVAMA